MYHVSMYCIIYISSIYVNIYMQFTSSLEILGNNRLWKDLSKGSKYWQLKPINFNSAKDCITKGTQKCFSACWFKSWIQHLVTATIRD